MCTIRAAWQVSQPTVQCLGWACVASLGIWSNTVLKIDVPSLPRNTTVQKYVYLLAIPNCEKREGKNAVGNSDRKRYYWTSLKEKCHNIFFLVLKEVLCQAGLKAEVKFKCSVYRLLRGNERKRRRTWVLELHSSRVPGPHSFEVFDLLSFWRGPAFGNCSFYGAKVEGFWYFLMVIELLQK